MNTPINALLTDLYQLNMMQAYPEGGETATAVFELFVRKLPRPARLPGGGRARAGGGFLENLQFSPDEIDWLAKTNRFSKQLIDYLATLRFTGDVHAMPEGTIFFPDEPILRDGAKGRRRSWSRTRPMNDLQFQSMVAAMGACAVLAAPGKLLVDFGLRRAHGGEAGLLAARASYLAGFAGTATVLADKLYGILIFGTMAHSFIRGARRRKRRVREICRARRENLTLLIDTYDTEAAARKVVALAPKLKAERSSCAPCASTAAISWRCPRRCGGSSTRAGSPT